jgi:hypothetical protein
VDDLSGDVADEDESISFVGDVEIRGFVLLEDPKSFFGVTGGFKLFDLPENGPEITLVPEDKRAVDGDELRIARGGVVNLEGVGMF